MTTLPTVGATKFRTFVIWMAGGGLSIGGTIMMGTVEAEMFCGPACKALSRND